MTSESQAVGLGVYILCTIWLVSLLLCIVSVRTGQLIGAIALIISSLITLILILIPRASPEPSPVEEQVYDRLFVLRYCSLAFLLLSLVGGLGCLIAFHCMSPVHTKKLRHWIQ